MCVCVRVCVCVSAHTYLCMCVCVCDKTHFHTTLQCTLQDRHNHKSWGPVFHHSYSSCKYNLYWCQKQVMKNEVCMYINRYDIYIQGQK